MSDDMPPGFGPNDRTAGDRAYTDHTDVSFTLKEGPNGEPWVIIEQDEPGLPVLKFGDAFLGLQFREGISFEEAKSFTLQLNRMLDVLSYTKFIT